MCLQGVKSEVRRRHVMPRFLATMFNKSLNIAKNVHDVGMHDLSSRANLTKARTPSYW